MTLAATLSTVLPWVAAVSPPVRMLTSLEVSAKMATMTQSLPSFSTTRAAFFRPVTESKALTVPISLPAFSLSASTQMMTQSLSRARVLSPMPS